MNEASNSGATAPNVHNGTYTVSHPERGHFTLKIYTARKGDLEGKRIIALLVGPDNETNYRGCAFWNDEQRVAYVWKRFKGAADLRIDGYHWTHEDSETKEEGVGLSATQKKLAIWADLAIRGDGTELNEDGSKRQGFWAGGGYRLQLAGHCCVCNRKLTDPTSISRGIGPVCEGRTS